tara:strand:+ start:327 stop:1127 length:801 start_codon:yes stop_codon:yes gene_type:complete
MSSIYKKGRDGFFYYQAYVYNPESKKKDKRIYHALGTKDLEVAKKHKKKFDLKYANALSYESNSVSPGEKVFRSQSFIFIITGILIFLVSLKLIQSVILGNRFDKVEMEIDDLLQIGKTDTNLSEFGSVADSDSAENILIDGLIKNSANDFPSNEMNSGVSEYTIERIEKISDTFKQCKIYVTADSNLGGESIRLICQNVKKQFNQFSNILICVYSDDIISKNYAKGEEDFFSLKEQNKYWLALYSYNSVEGEYFDNNPGEYRLNN